ncbi:MAG TPA: glycosyltransferase [Candidatus Ozemobacteraceae bacterium]|nr:glycosyltransferase [Candidatus Ozemobacteraceae bacterium]
MIEATPSRLLFAAPAAWSALRQRHQALAEGLAAAGWDVTYLDPLRSGGWFFEKRDLGRRLRLFSLRVPFRAAEFPGLQAIAARLALRHLVGAGLEPTTTVFWTADPSLSALAPLPWRSVIYDRCDRHGSFPGQRASAWKAHEQRLYRHADLILASSPLLAREASAAGAKHVALVPNAADRSWRSPPPPQRPSGPPWRLLSSGAHFEWVDHTWLAGLARLPGVELHLAGPGRGPAWERLIDDPRVTWHGILDHGRLRELIDRCHIGLIPFRDDALTAGVDPVKAYEYAARGLAIWAPETTALQRHPLVTRIVTPGNAPAHLAADGARVPIQAFPATWDDRLAQIRSLLKGMRDR